MLKMSVYKSVIIRMSMYWLGKELFEKISFGECRLGFVPFDSDMLSLEMDSVFKQVYIIYCIHVSFIKTVIFEFMYVCTVCMYLFI